MSKRVIKGWIPPDLKVSDIGWWDKRDLFREDGVISRLKRFWVKIGEKPKRVTITIEIND